MNNNYIELYSKLMHPVKVVPTPIPKQVIDPPPKPLIRDAVKITLAEYEPTTKGVITAHHIADYRHKQKKLCLLQKQITWFDLLMEVSNWNE